MYRILYKVILCVRACVCMPWLFTMDNYNKLHSCRFISFWIPTAVKSNEMVFDPSEAAFEG